MKFSLKQYALLLSFLTFFIFIGFGWYTYNQIESAKITLADWKFKSTHEELTEAIKTAVEQGTRAVRKFAGWGESRQQILNSTFYSYWREQRMMSAGFLPTNALTAQLYNARGESLSAASELSLPFRIDPQHLPGHFVTQEKDQAAYAVFFASVYSQGGQSVIGFVSINLPFLPLITNHKFYHINEKSIRIKAQSGHIPMARIIDYIDYEKKQDISSIVVQTILDNTSNGLLIASLIIAVLLYILLVYGVKRPLQYLIDHIYLLRKNPDFLHSTRFLKQLPIKELNEVSQALNAYQEELNNVYGSLDEKNKELMQLAYTDVLTGIKNRRAFNEYWQQVCHIAENSRLDICMMLFDIDHFKAINDSYGHQVGDEVLAAISRLISCEFRKGELLYRLGGDEFGTVIINCNEKTGFEIARRCNESVSRFNFSSLGIMEKVQISIGIACTQSGNKVDLDNLGWQADSAVFQSKHPGKESVFAYHPEMASSSRSLFSNWMYSAVFKAIETGEGIKIHYQPIVKLSNNTISYYESLVKIQHKDEIIPPSHIFPIISARNLDAEMDQVIVKAIIDDLENERIPEGTGVSINLSGPSVSNTELISWVQPLSQYLSNYKLVFEITETTLISQMSKATDNLQQLKAMGFLIALDDFGSGYSSLRYLGSMPVDIVKFDISLIKDLENPRQHKLILNLCKMIKEIGYEMVAEGIEYSETHQSVVQAGFEYGQGFLFGKPGENFNPIKFQ
ncbi:MAG: bifunctional diguanylate cyclase/phosphodiesterase [Gammaproteobacteria bacterium]|nr:bifunctional diguanylate cyclase/phosphodiesterase [Gammaproteobacteria bacterium]